MDTIGKEKIWTFCDNHRTCQIMGNTTIRNKMGHEVEDYIDLARKVAELQFRNRDYVLFFRGQGTDHKNRQRNTTLKPTIFRGDGTKNPGAAVLLERFERLARAEAILTKAYKSKGFIGRDRLLRHRILRWSILQHYEVCPTPLLDVTHSLRIAASFACTPAERKKGAGKAFVYVLGVPNLSGAITASAEGLQIVRLCSVCPPTAMRPHVQEGYLLGEYPEIGGYEQKSNYRHYEVDFGLRLVAKFRFDPDDFWKHPEFPPVTIPALYPDEADPLCTMANEIKSELDSKAASGVR